jgi:hypothetical protein
MVVEHDFVTTMEAPEALQEARVFLQWRGFVSESGPAHDDEHVLQLVRGETRASAAKSVAALPQRARIEYDRGRVTVALSIAPSSTWGGGGVFAAQGKLHKMHLHRDLLMAIASGLEDLLARGTPAEQSAAAWDNVEQRIAAAAAKHKRRSTITLAIVGIIVGCLVAFAITVATK